MKKLCVIFDLDQTLTDTYKLKSYRDSRQWSKVYDMIPSLKYYEGIGELITKIATNNYIGIFTNSPKSYAERVLNQLCLHPDALVCYHDVKFRKPSPDGIQLILQMLAFENKARTIVVGDEAIDIAAANNCGVKSIAVSWGLDSMEKLMEHKPSYIANSAKELELILSEL